eukprot:scpid15252/ scgid29365/ 
MHRAFRFSASGMNSRTRVLRQHDGKQISARAAAHHRRPSIVEPICSPGRRLISSGGGDSNGSWDFENWTHSQRVTLCNKESKIESAVFVFQTRNSWKVQICTNTRRTNLQVQSKQWITWRFEGNWLKKQPRHATPATSNN